LLQDRHALLTIRNLTHCTDGFIECSAMNVITVRRTVFRRANKRSRSRRSFRELTRAYFARENSLKFVAEALLFVIIVAISVWPILAAAGALREFFQRALT
jgi:RNase P protein component